MILQVQVFVLRPDQDDDQFESEFFINIAKRGNATRLTRCIEWAARNGRSVTAFAKGAD